MNNDSFIATKKERKSNIIAAVAMLLAGLWQLIALKYVAPVCPPKADGSHMRCLQTGKAAELLAILVVAMALLLLFLAKQKNAGLSAGVANIFLGLANLAIPLYYFPVCKMKTMPCVVGTLPNIYIVSAVLIIVGLYYAKLTADAMKNGKVK